jgi:hypothetical protein
MCEFYHNMGALTALLPVKSGLARRPDPVGRSQQRAEAGMAEKHTRGELHGCIVCGKLYQMYVVYDAGGRLVDCKVMSAGGKRVHHAQRPLVACEGHGSDEIKNAVERVFGPQQED